MFPNILNWSASSGGRFRRANSRMSAAIAAATGVANDVPDMETYVSLQYDKMPHPSVAKLSSNPEAWRFISGSTRRDSSVA